MNGLKRFWMARHFVVLKNDAIDLTSMEFDSSNFEPLLDRTSAVPKITFEFF